MSAPSRTACLFVPVSSAGISGAGGEASDPDCAELQERLLEIAAGFSPLVEDGRELAEEPESGLGFVRIKTKGLGLLHKKPEALLEAMVAAADQKGLPPATASLADTPGAAAVLARALAIGRAAGESSSRGARLSRWWISPRGWDRRSLSPLPLHLLSAPEAPALPKESLEKLGLLAVRTAGAFAALPAASVEKRFGPGGLRLHRLARGEAHRPLRPWQPDTVFEKEADLEDPVERMSALEAILADLLEDLCDDLRRSRRGMARLLVSYETRGPGTIRREIESLDPMAGPKDWLRLLRLDLEQSPPGGAVRRILVRATCVTARRSGAEDLFQGLPEPESDGTSGIGKRDLEKGSMELARAAARIKSRLGEGGIGVPALDDRHRPEAAFHLDPSLPEAKGSPHGIAASRGEAPPRAAPQLALRLVSPLPVSVVTGEDGRPAKVGGEEAVSAGPFPASGEWWASPYDRSYFEVATRSGLLWIYRDGIDACWYVHGIFD